MHIWYQPVVDLRTDAIVRAEALLRPEPDVEGVRRPDEIVLDAERLGEIRALADTTFERAFDDWRALGRPDIGLSINLSLKNLDERDLAKRVESALRRRRLDPRLLSVELSERVQLVVEPTALEQIARLTRLGVRLSLDGFGRGISHTTPYDLQRLPLADLKLDPRIVAQIDVDLAARSQLASVVELGRSLGVDVVAKGIERKGVALAAARLGCTHGQGFYFAEPMPIAELARVLAAPKRADASGERGA